MGLKWRFLVVAMFFRFSGPYKRMIKYIVYVIRHEEESKNPIYSSQFFCILYQNPVMGPETFYIQLWRYVRKKFTENLVKKLLEKNYLVRFGEFTNSGKTSTHELQCKRILDAETMEERKGLLEELDVYKKTDKLIYYQEL